MAKLPEGFSVQAVPIKAAMAEGRDEDAKTMLCEILREGRADKVVQSLAAELLKPSKRKRGRRKVLAWRWMEIAEHFLRLREDEGHLYEDALRLTAEGFGRSETHVRNCVTLYTDAQDEISAIKADLFA